MLFGGQVIAYGSAIRIAWIRGKLPLAFLVLLGLTVLHIAAIVFGVHAIFSGHC